MGNWNKGGLFAISGKKVRFHAFIWHWEPIFQPLISHFQDEVEVDKFIRALCIFRTFWESPRSYPSRKSRLLWIHKLDTWIFCGLNKEPFHNIPIEASRWTNGTSGELDRFKKSPHLVTMNFHKRSSRFNVFFIGGFGDFPSKSNAIWNLLAHQLVNNTLPLY